MTAAPFTYEDYAALPDDGNRWEVLDGELVLSPSPILIHQAVLRNLVRIVDGHVTTQGLGTTFFAPLDVILARTTVVQPDMIFISTARAAVMTAKAIEGAPDLLVEILSPGTARRDLGIKAVLYALRRRVLLGARSACAHVRGARAGERDMGARCRGARRRRRRAGVLPEPAARPRRRLGLRTGQLGRQCGG